MMQQPDGWWLAGESIPDSDRLIHASRNEHVNLFFRTQKAAEAQQEASKKIATMKATLDRCS
jgi:hypothetical protein